MLLVSGWAAQAACLLLSSFTVEYWSLLAIILIVDDLSIKENRKVLSLDSELVNKQLYHVETLQIIVVSALLSPSFPCDLNAALACRQFLSEQHGSIKHGSIHSSDQMFTRHDSDFWFQQLHWVIWTLTCRRLNEPTCGSVGVLSEFWSLTCPACSVKLSLIFTITFSFASSFGAMSMQATHCGCSDTQNRQLAASSLSRAGS